MSDGRRDSPVRLVHAAGAVLYRMDGDVPQCAVVHRSRYDDWSLPKGKVDPGESLPMTAIRELREETGSECSLGRRLGTTAYPLKENTRKEVTYWAALASGGAFTPNDEVDELRWLPVDEASALVSYPLDRKVLRWFDRMSEPPAMVLLVRHAKAGRRSQWSGEDSQRPLTKNGRAQAELLAPMLEAFGPRRVHAAPRVRCAQTVAPLAEELGQSVGTEPAFADEAWEADPGAARRRLLELAEEAASLGGCAVVCSQGTAIPGIVADLASDSALDLDGTATRKAGVWALGLDGGRLVSADLYPDPSPLR